MSWEFFVRRPIFASVLSLIIVLAGLLAFKVLPVAQYPQIAPPVATITVSYLGASAETLIKTVAAPIEEEINGTDNLLYYSSNASSTGLLTINVTFEPGSDPDLCIINLTNRVKIAESRLPDDARRLGVIVKKRSNDILMAMSVISRDGTRDSIYLSNYASINLVDEIKRVPGVGDAGVFGARDYSMRVWLQPDKMSRLGVTTGDVTKAIRATNNQYAAGRLGQEPTPDGQAFSVPIITAGRLSTPEEFGEIIIRSAGAAGTLRLRDVARLELGAQSYEQQATLDGKTAVGIRIFLAPGANALDVADAVKAKVATLSKRFPAGVDYEIPFDTTRFVKASITEVEHTLFEAGILVVLVVFLFLGSWRATLIPMLAVPVSLIGTFAGLWLFGFGINTLTLFAMVIAIGIVVDDAIVMLENVERLMHEKGMSPFDAAIASVREVSGAIVAIVLVLVSVFLPVAFLGGIAGALYRQFAITVAVAVVISGFVALTLTPALCALILRPRDAEAPHGNAFLRWFEARFNSVAAWHGRTVRWLLGHPKAALGIFLAILVANVVLIRLIPRGFIPSEDQGYVLGVVSLPDGASVSRTRTYMAEIVPEIMATPAPKSEVFHAFAISGFDLIGGGEKTNAGTIFIPLIPWDQRKYSSEQLSGMLTGAAAKSSKGMCFVVNPPPIRGIGSAGGFEFYLQARDDDDPAKLGKVLDGLLAALRKRPELSGINTFYRTTVPQYAADVDQVRAAALGIPLPDIYDALQTTIGSVYVNDFTRAGRTYRVLMQSEPSDRMALKDIGRVHVRANDGAMVPLTSLVTVRESYGPDQIERYQGFVAARVIGGSVPGVSSSDALRIVEETAAENLPPGYELDWTAQALQEKRSASSAVPAFSMALLMVFLILAALYEKWSLPVGVILTVPFALLGALVAIFVRGSANDIYFQIGLVTLIGLAAKNAILIVEFAVKARDEGKNAAEAAIEAARIRFRPLVMTSMAFVLGVVPLVIAAGAGAGARRSMGTGVFGGMLFDTFVATLFIPLFFKVLTGDRKEPRA
ncbi:MAG: multidrug efflux RND transporter permease subunit [Verrucomicrobia bacterium]|nr:multidrug efflux RND transporter permease subunit [Verrucomicrobiota bacterium]